LATLPRRFFVEGTEPSAALRENTITLQYFYINPFGMLTAAARDDVKVTVTPVIDRFTVTKGNVGVNGVRFKLGNNGLFGIQAGDPIRNGPGVLFDATLITNGVTGSATYIQNILAMENGTIANHAGAYIYADPARTVGRNVLAKGQFPSLDKLGERQPPPPDYSNPPIRNRFNVGALRKEQDKLGDSPSTVYQIPQKLPRQNYPGPALLRDVDMRYKFKTYLVWRFGQPDQGIIYTLATFDWRVDYLADTFIVNQWVTRIAPGSGIFVDPNFTRTHNDPGKLVGPTGNVDIRVR